MRPRRLQTIQTRLAANFRVGAALPCARKTISLRLTKLHERQSIMYQLYDVLASVYKIRLKTQQPSSNDYTSPALTSLCSLQDQLAQQLARSV